ncbi:MAG: hypothetical protein ACYSYL_00070 [Planctomycetota bacterium]
MADTIEFSKAYFRDAQLPHNLEDAIRLTCSYAGLHDFDFKYEIDDGFTSLADWTIAAGASATVSDNDLYLTGGGGSSKWWPITHDLEIPLGLVASFDWTGGTGGFFFKKNADDKRCFLLWWTSSSAGAAYVDADGTGHNMTIVPRGFSTPARLQVLARYSLDSTDDERKWVQGLLFADGRAWVGFALDIGGTALDWDDYGVGFIAYEDASLRVDNLQIAELHRLVEWTIIDPGQAPASGMSRAVGTTRVTYMCRYDNTLRVWRPGNRDLDFTPAAGRVTRSELRREAIRATHVRVQAAIHEADAFDDDEGAVHGHRFVITNDPNVMTESEAFIEAERVLHDHGERARVGRFILPPCYLLEPNDRIYVDGQDWRVISAHTSMQMTMQGPRIAQVVECQGYEEQ